jgi:hypothetical protein
VHYAPLLFEYKSLFFRSMCAVFSKTARLNNDKKQRSGHLFLYVSDNVNWQAHADYEIGKLESAVFLMSKIVRLKELLLVYYAYSYSIMQYGIVF